MNMRSAKKSKNLSTFIWEPYTEVGFSQFSQSPNTVTKTANKKRYFYPKMFSKSKKHNETNL